MNRRQSRTAPHRAKSARRGPRLKRVFGCALPFLLIGALGARASVTKDDSARFHKKLLQISDNGRAKRPTALKTAITETEVNSYLVYGVGPTLPSGISEPQVTIQDNSRLAGRAIVDLGQLKRERASGGLDPLSLLSGKVPVTAEGILRTNSGMGRLELESTTIAGIGVPKMLLQALVSHYTRSADDPDGISLDDPFKLPAGIREIRLAKGQAVVIQ
jgi:hypothetical protein